MRFLMQWIQSERKKKSVIPMSFWYFSIGGSMILFIYAVFYLKDPVFTLGQAFGIVVYTRNIMLIYRHKSAIIG
ncbi:MAG: lipid-A-disaccharide synthase N-terminal domain-containing protein [Candidatus Omnitrophica bacterium]|nr:lipid-A-disaccharide synthase N-terminal domain-containing protein [Candidatus Omnitrophota bacterium]